MSFPCHMGLVARIRSAPRPMTWCGSLIVSTNSNPDVAEYPDTGKVGIITQAGDCSFIDGRMLSTTMRRRKRLALVISLLAFMCAAAVGIGYAAIPNGGVITGCYMKSGGALRVVDATVTNCKTGETRLDWNMQGVKGDQGIQGVKGDQGIQGIQGVKGDQGI